MRAYAGVSLVRNTCDSVTLGKEYGLSGAEAQCNVTRACVTLCDMGVETCDILG